MRRVGWQRIALILAILVVSVASVAVQSFDLRFLGLRLERGSDSFLGMKLGLDLQGGLLLIYQAKRTKELTITFQEPVNLDAVRSVLTEMGKTDVQVEGAGERGVTISLPTLTEEEQEAIRLALEEQVGAIATVGDLKDIERTVERIQMEGVLDIITRRINPFGVTEPELQLMDSNRVLVQLPGTHNVEEVKLLIGQTASLEFKERTCLASGQTVLPDGQLGDLCDLPENQDDKEVNLGGDDLARAFPGTHPQTGRPVVNINFTSNGAKIFADMTTRLAGTRNRFVIFLDEDEIIDPVVVQPILAGNAFIEGPTFTPERVHTMAIQLESGRLPIPIEVIQEQNVDATLGAESLRKSLIAGTVGLGLVLLFMVMYYRTAGVVAAMALVIYTAMILAIFKLVPVTLTLGGVAAFILSIGMAVDANILIFERMKEELRLERTLSSAIEIGFNRAWTAIRDSNVSTLITCAILFWFGQRLGASVVSGFAATLAIGVAVSMFSAIFVSKTLLNIFAASPLGRRRTWFTPETLPAPSRAAGATIAEERE